MYDTNNNRRLTQEAPALLLCNLLTDANGKL